MPLLSDILLARDIDIWLRKCIDTIRDAGYDFPVHERVVIHQSPSTDFLWTVARPPIVFGTITPLSELNRPTTSVLVSDPVSDELSPVHAGITPVRFVEAGLPPIQNNCQVSDPVILKAHQASSPPMLLSQIAFGPSTPTGPSPLDRGQDIPSSQEAARQFEAMVDDMVNRVITCTLCS